MTAPYDAAAAADALIGATIAALVAGPDDPAPSVGRSADEQVSATLGADGTVTGLELDPRVLRVGAEALAVRIIEAVNAAVDARPPNSGTARNEQLRALQEESLVQATAMRTALKYELNRLVAGAREED